MVREVERVAAIDDLIDDLVAHHTKRDPENKYGFSSHEIWEWRLIHFGWGQLIKDWHPTKVDGCAHEVVRPSRLKGEGKPCCADCLTIIPLH